MIGGAPSTVCSPVDVRVLRRFSEQGPEKKEAKDTVLLCSSVVEANGGGSGSVGLLGSGSVFWS